MCQSKLLCDLTVSFSSSWVRCQYFNFFDFLLLYFMRSTILKKLSLTTSNSYMHIIHVTMHATSPFGSTMHAASVFSSKHQPIHQQQFLVSQTIFYLGSYLSTQPTNKAKETSGSSYPHYPMGLTSHENKSWSNRGMYHIRPHAIPVRRSP